MAIAVLAWLVVALVLAPVGAAIRFFLGPFTTPDGLVGTALQLVWIFVLFVVVQQVYIRIERWDAIRSGRPPQR